MNDKAVRRLIRELERMSGREIQGRTFTVFFNHPEISDVDKFMSLEYQDFKELEGVGEKTAQALVDIQNRSRQRASRHVRRERTYDIRHRNLTEDVRVLRTSPLTRRIELIIGRSIAGTTDVLINDFGFVDIGRFLLVTSDWLARRNVSVLERNNIRDIQEAVRNKLLAKHETVYYSDKIVPLLYVDDGTQGDPRVVSVTSELLPEEIYVIDVKKKEVSRIEHKLFFMGGKRDIDAAVLNTVAEYYNASVCRKSLAMAIGRVMLQGKIR